MFIFTPFPRKIGQSEFKKALLLSVFPICAFVLLVSSNIFSFFQHLVLVTLFANHPFYLVS